MRISKFAAMAIALAGVVYSQSAPPPRPADQATARKYFTDTVLVDQDGASHRFYSDLLEGKVVVIDVMFTTCKDSCPRMAANFAGIARWLGPRLGKDVRMLSISIDPETDTPPLLKAYAERFDAPQGWYFLGGKKEDVNTVLKKLGLYVPDKQDHVNIFLIGNNRTGLWKKAFGMADSKDLISVLDSVIRDGK